MDLCWFVITSELSKSGAVAKGITDVWLGGASGGTEVIAIERM